MTRRSLAILIGSMVVLAAGVALAPPQADDDAIRDLGRRRAELARKQLAVIERAILNPPLVQEPQGPKSPVRVEELFQWSQRIAAAEHDQSSDHDGRVKAARDHRDRLASYEEPLKKLIERKAAGLTDQDAEALGFFRLEAETDWLKARQGR